MYLYISAFSHSGIRTELKLLLAQRKDTVLRPEVSVKNSKSQINLWVKDSLNTMTFNVKF